MSACLVVVLFFGGVFLFVLGLIVATWVLTGMDKQ